MPAAGAASTVPEHLFPGWQWRRDGCFKLLGAPFGGQAFIEAHTQRGEEVGFVAERGYQLHDLFHVLTGYDTSPFGEIRVVSFTVAQTPAPYPALTIALRLLQSTLYRPELIGPMLDAVSEGWALGRKAKPLIEVHWEDYWDRPVLELRKEYDLV